MEFLNRFCDTIVLKEDSNLEKQIEELKKVREEVPDYYKDKVDYDIKMLEIGLEGEKEILYELKHADIGMYVLHDITIEYEDLKAQFDFIIVTKGYIYLIECKKLIGNIKVDRSGQFIIEYEYKNDKYSKSIYSPYTQVIKHKDILKKRWINKNSKLRVAIQEKYFDKLWYKPIVVLANSKSILDIKYAPKEVRESTIKVDRLVDYIKKDINKYDSRYYNSKKEMEEIANTFINNNIDSYHNIADNYSEIINDKHLESNLKHFRREKSKKMNVPPYYIFNNDELDEIIKNKPKNLDQLKSILPNIKIKCHGKEILNIINK